MMVGDGGSNDEKKKQVVKLTLGTHSSADGSERTLVAWCSMLCVVENYKRSIYRIQNIRFTENNARSSKGLR